MVIASDMHLESESEKRAKNVDLLTAKKYPDTTNTFSLFLDEFLETGIRPTYCSLTTQTILVGLPGFPVVERISMTVQVGTSCFLSFSSYTDYPGLIDSI